MMGDDAPTITIDESAFDTVIDAFGWHFDEFGFIVDEDDNLVTDTKERPIMRQEFGGIVPDENDDPVPIRDNFCDICDHVFEHEKTYEDELELRERSTDIREVGIDVRE